MDGELVILAIDPGLANTGIALGKLDISTGSRSLLHTELFHTDPDLKEKAQGRFKDHALRASALCEDNRYMEWGDGSDQLFQVTHLVSEWPQGRKDGAVILGIWLGAFPECEQCCVHPRTWQAAMFKEMPGDTTKLMSKFRATIDWGEEAHGYSDHVHDALNMLTWYMDKLYLENIDTKFLDNAQGKIDSMRRVTGARRKR